MIAEVGSWMKNIMYMILFATFFELLLPGNPSMRRFSRLIVGLFIMLAILSPAGRILNSGLWAEDIPVISTKEQGSFDTQMKGMVKDREEISREVYRRELARQVEVIAGNLDGIAAAKAVVELAGGKEEKVPRIAKITVFVRKTGSGSEAVSAVIIGGPPRGAKAVDQPAIEKVRQTVAAMYQLKPSQIEVVSEGE